MSPSRSRHVGPIDWRDVHERLDRTASALGAAVPMPPEEIQAILDERARVLARVPPTLPAASEMIEIVTFSLAGERLALETRFVRRVLGRWESTPVPGAPEGLFGVANLHGEVLALFELRALFGMAAADQAAPTQLLVLGEARDELGILAESVGEVRALRIADLREPPASLDGLGRRCLRGVTADALIVIDGEVLLADERLFIQQAEESGA